MYTTRLMRTSPLARQGTLARNLWASSGIAARPQRVFYSTEPNSQIPPAKEATQEKRKQVSPHIGFYQSFGRPVAKVLLMSVIVYQLTYWLWKKLENDEFKAGQTAEIRRLEDEVRRLAGVEGEGEGTGKK